mmetsp:Transcript_14360/g.41012  ORF Transcript_14360/g.41012 Transcript_14360/m.41012 type:complete len:207 (-) Transcript_14360:108-728(-)|eukprot:CAMPEP_0182609674 /NCGR_PEP_ID=MMETSP1330-20130603/3798_1 /TAXON_ID=464278 /ORGANISM="Picochlorum sp., Strain RCC944" /LENGTH=206 /DNA_ID=CAMNT_0024828549 /DNA_START=90 /DNA_END=710 /DNA_ORIENTATION=+
MFATTAKFSRANPRTAPVSRSTVQTTAKMSRIGKQTIQVPEKTTVTIKGNDVVVKGPKGQLSRTLHPLVSISQEGNVVSIQRLKETKTANAIHGLERALVNNMVIGVTNGFEKTLSMIGVGYRAAVNGKTLTLSLGYSHPVEMAIPEGIKVEVVKNTTIIVSGHDKEQVGQFSSDVRSKREPEPYKGKGVRYVDEYVAKKEGKRGK